MIDLDFWFWYFVPINYTDEIPRFSLFLKKSRVVKILVLSFTYEDIDVAMVTNMSSQLRESVVRIFTF